MGRERDHSVQAMWPPLRRMADWPPTWLLEPDNVGAAPLAQARVARSQVHCVAIPSLQCTVQPVVPAWNEDTGQSVGFFLIIGFPGRQRRLSITRGFCMADVSP